MSLALPFSQWSLAGHSIVEITDGVAGNYALRLSGRAGSYPNQGTFVPIVKGKKYRVRFLARPSSDAAGLLYFSFRQFKSDNTTLPGPTNGGRAPYKPSGKSRAQHIAEYGDTWGEYKFTWSDSDWQAGTKYLLPEFLDNYSGGAGHWDIQDFAIYDATELDDLSAAIQTEATARADTDGTLLAKYTVKVDVAGHVSGFGLASTSNNSTPSSDFAIRADRFYVAPPATSSATAPTTNLYVGFVWVDTSVTPNVTKYWTGSAWSTTQQAVFPFVVQTTPQTINGETVPPGVYMDTAYMRRFVANTGQIGDLAVTNAKIASLAVDKLTAGSLSVGQYIQSTGFVSGSSGWRIDGNGNAEFANATVRGTVYATGGEFKGHVIGGSASAYGVGVGMFSGWTSDATDANYRWRVGSPNGARIQWTGTAIEVYNESGQLTLNSGGVDWSAISSKPEFGAMASVNKITSENISTYMDGAVINHAFIGDMTGVNITGTTGIFTGTLSASSFSNALSTGETQVFATVGTHQIVVPQGKRYTRMRVYLVGGGGGGGQECMSYNEGSGVGAGGGGGGLFVGIFSVSEGTVYTVGVGQGGAGTPYVAFNGRPGANGGNGSPTYIENLGTGFYVAAGGGMGGQGGQPSTNAVGGNGGSGTTPGAKGGNAIRGYDAEGYYTDYTGKGGNSGAGGAGGASHNLREHYRTKPVAASGSNYGGGGAGGGYFTNNNRGGGGAGAQGIAIIDFYNPNGVILRDEWETFLNHIRANHGINFTYTP